MSPFRSASIATATILMLSSAARAQLPAPWSDQDVGATGVPGSASFANGVFTISGSGSDIWGAADAFHYVYESGAGDLEIIARVTSLENTSAFAKAGLMVRNSLASDSAHVILDVKPDGGIEFMTRSTAGGQTSVIASAAEALPIWLKLTLSSSVVTGATSPDGAAWTTLGSTTLSGPATYVGMAVSSVNNSALNTSTFDNVSASGGLPPPWGDQDVGATGVSGAASFANGVFTISGSGADIWGTADAFHYAYQSKTGDVEIVARVTSVENTNPHAKAGLMVRNTLASDAVHVILDATPGGIEFMTRSTTAGETAVVASTTDTVPIWLKLTVSGSTVSGATSADGAAWTTLGSTGLSGPAAYIGMAVSSVNNSALNTSTFDNVSVSGGTASSSSLPVVTWNVKQNTGEAAQQMDVIASMTPTPQVVLLNEALNSLMSTYTGELQARTGVTWTGHFQGHCALGSWDGSSCGSIQDEGVAVLTSLPMSDPAGLFLPGEDCWHSARGAVHATVDLAGTAIQIFTTHLQTGTCTDAQQMRLGSIATLKSWAAGYSRPQLIGGDFNATPGSTEISDTNSGMASTFADAWSVVHGSGAGETYPTPSPYERIDYWFSDIGGRLWTNNVDVATEAGTLSDHYPVKAVFNLAATNEPFSGVPASLPGRVEAEAFDHGGEGVAYHDSTLLNLGGASRIDQSVDLEATSDIDGNQDVGYFDVGEWLSYRVHVATAGVYSFNLRLASPCSGGSVHLDADGSNVTGAVPVPNTGGWQAWQTVAVTVSLAAGDQTLRLMADTGACGSNGQAALNANWFSIE